MGAGAETGEIGRAEDRSQRTLSSTCFQRPALGLPAAGKAFAKISSHKVSSHFLGGPSSKMGALVAIGPHCASFPPVRMVLPASSGAVRGLEMPVKGRAVPAP